MGATVGASEWDPLALEELAKGVGCRWIPTKDGNPQDGILAAQIFVPLPNWLGGAKVLMD